MEKGKKRKRNLDLPRITYHASGRTFERLFKEESLGEMETVIRRKLGLPENTSICLAQLREEKSIDLEDDDDFDAFYSIAHSTSSVSVRVTLREDATPSLGARKMSVKGKKGAEAKPGLTANVSHETTENELIVVEDELVPAAEKDNDTPTFKSSVVRSGDNDMLEGTSKPRKKKKKSTTESAAVSEISSGPNLISSLNNLGFETNVSQAPPTAEVDASISAPQVTAIASDQNSAKSRNARRKDRLKKSQATPTVELPLSALPTGGDGIRKSDKKKTQQDVPFADQLASAISKTSAHNRKHSGNLPKTSVVRQGGEKSKASSVAENVISMGGPDVIQGVSLRRQQSATSESEGNKISHSEDRGKTPEDAEFRPPRKKAKGKRRASTTYELEAANADVKAAFSRILAAKRASLSSSLADHSPTEYPENTIVPPKDQLIQHSEGVALQPNLNGKSDKPGARVSEPSKNMITNGLPKVHRRISDPNTSRNSSKSSDDGSEDQNRSGAAILPAVSADASLYADFDLDALIRGPKISAKAIADSVSTDSSEDAQSLELTEDEEESQIRRRTRKIVASDSSSEEDMNDDDDDDDNQDSVERDQHPLFGVDSAGSGSPHPDSGSISLEHAARLGMSDVDNGSNDAFQAAEVAGAVTLRHAAPAPDYVANVSNDDQNSDGGMCLGPPGHNLSQKETHFPHRSSLHDTGNGSVETQRSDGIIRRMKGRSGKYSDKDSVAGTSTVISMDENGQTQVDPQQTHDNAMVTIEGSPDKTMSMAAWTTLRASSPPPDVESTIMIDELQSSSPGSQVNVKNLILTPPSSHHPLFILTESQPPFPYSQWNGDGPDDNQDSNDSEDEEGHASRHSQSQSKTVQPPYRKLTDIANQHFPTLKLNIRPALSPGNKLENMYGISGEVDSDSDTESDTDSDVPVTQKSSHIPKSRIAGISRPTRSALM